MAKPKRVGFTKLTDNQAFDFGQQVAIDLDGDTGDTATGAGARRTGLLIRAFSQVDGFPFDRVIVNNLVAQENDPGGNPAQGTFKTDGNNPPTFVPQNRGIHTITVFAWDRRTPPATSDDVRVKRLRITVR
jgi:hypothetical protein